MGKSTLGRTIFSTLAERILRWDYLPGYRFTEEALCAEFEVSRSPVREALNMLAENGLVERKPMQGCSVRLLDFDEIDELYDVRLALEEFVVARLCRRELEAERVDELMAYWADLHDRLPETANLVPAADERFHETLAGLAKNGALSKALEDIDRRIHFVRMADFRSAERVRSTCAEHLELLRAIKEKDETRAIGTLRLNIEGGRSSVESAIKEALAHAYRNKG